MSWRFSFRSVLLFSLPPVCRSTWPPSQGLCNLTDTNAQFYLVIHKSQFKNIIDQVVNTILEWAMKFNEDGIKGDAFLFTEEEILWAGEQPKRKTPSVWCSMGILMHYKSRMKTLTPINPHGNILKEKCNLIINILWSRTVPWASCYGRRCRTTGSYRSDREGSPCHGSALEPLLQRIPPHHRMNP